LEIVGKATRLVVTFEMFLDGFADDRGEVVTDLELPVISDEITVALELEVRRSDHVSARRIDLGGAGNV
jgi:hypothetical protein